MTANPFDSAYVGTPPWDIGRPQRAFKELFNEGKLAGRVLDVGCGTGDLAIFLAGEGLNTWGIDASGLAVKQAAEKARAAQLDGSVREFAGEISSMNTDGSAAITLGMADALNLGALKTSFDTIIDCGFFHALSDNGRLRYRRSLEAISKPGTTLHILCFSEHEPNWGGPRRVTQKELRQTFSGGWVVEQIRAARFENLVTVDGSASWLCSVIYLGSMAPGVN